MAGAMTRRPINPQTARALQNIARQRGLDTTPPDQFPRRRQGMDSFPENQNLSSLIGQAGISTYIFQLAVTEGQYLGGEAAAVGIDVFRAAGVPAQSNPSGIIYPPFPEYNTQISWFLTNNVFIRGIRFNVPNTSDAINFLNSMSIYPSVYSPQAGQYQLSNGIPFTMLFSPAQFNTWILDFMGNFLLNGWSFFNLKSSIPAAADYTISMTVVTGQPSRLSDNMAPPSGVLPNMPGAPFYPSQQVGAPPGYNSNGQQT